MNWVNSAEGKKRISEYNKGLNAKESHERAMRINRAWYEERQRDGLTYTELAKRHGVSREMARVRCLKWEEGMKGDTDQKY